MNRKITTTERTELKKAFDDSENFRDALIRVCDLYLSNRKFTEEQRMQIYRIRAQIDIQLKDL